MKYAPFPLTMLSHLLLSPTNAQIFFLLVANLQCTLQWSNKQICYKETLVRSDHPMMILLYIYIVHYVVRASVLPF
jgi:hypothetical protein